jgi:CRP/FNR family transcriptional regulator, anaerobic regulatory protein
MKGERSMRTVRDPPCLAILGGADPKMREAITQLCAVKRFRAGETVQHETDGARFVGFVVEGVLRLVKYRPDGHKHIIGLLFEDAMFGRLFDRMPPVTVEASTDAVIISFERRAFEALLMQNRELEHRILMAVCDELDSAHEGMLILSSPLKSERVATFLLQVWRHARARSPDGANVETITLPVSRVDMAQYLGTSPETISRILSGFVRDKVIGALDRRSIRMPDRDKLVGLSGWDSGDWVDLEAPGDTRSLRFANARSARAIAWSPPRRAKKALGAVQG